MQSPPHNPDPDASLYLPALQAVQFPPLGPVKPGTHVQLPSTTDPRGESELAGQLLQGSVPVVPLNFPAAQAAQAAPSGPVYPILQVQLATLTLLL